MSIEAMKQALNVLDDIWNSRLPLHNVDDIRKAKASLSQAIKEHALREVQRLGQEIEQEPVTWSGGYPELRPRKHHEVNPPQLEQNFCPRCGKRTNDIHTCTPPQRTEEKNT